MHCLFIHGPIAAGKLTVATELQKLSGLPVHHNHFAVDSALSLFPFGSAPFIRLREQLWRCAFQEAALAGQSFIFTFAPEASVRRGLVDELIRIVEAASGRVLFIELVCLQQEIENRIAASGRARHGKLTSLALYRDLREQGAFAFPDLPASAVSVDTGQLAPQAAAAAILARISSVLERP